MASGRAGKGRGGGGLQAVGRKVEPGIEVAVALPRETRCILVMARVGTLRIDRGDQYVVDPVNARRKSLIGQYSQSLIHDVND